MRGTHTPRCRRKDSRNTFFSRVNETLYVRARAFLKSGQLLDTFFFFGRANNTHGLVPTLTRNYALQSDP